MRKDVQVLEIGQMWEEQFHRQLPHELPFRQPHGFDLTSIDSFSAGCITVFLESPTRFVRDEQRLEVLRKCADRINEFWDGLAEDEKEYFGHLRQIATKILEWCAGRSSEK
jgi:hypothetical protein